MAIKIQTTRNYGTDGVKILVYSPAGIGKTRLCETAPNPLIISNEAGLLSLADYDVAMVETSTVKEIDDVYDMLTSDSKEAEYFETICLDSITEIAEVMLIQYKQDYKDPRQAYGLLADDMGTLIRKFRDIKGKHVYFTAKQMRIQDDDGVTMRMPGMPGKTLLNGLSFFFDEVFVLRLGKLEDNTIYRYLQTFPDFSYDAKDRSGKMLPKAMPDLTNVFDIISGKVEAVQESELDEVVVDAKGEAEAEAKDDAATEGEEKEVEPEQDET